MLKNLMKTIAFMQFLEKLILYHIAHRVSIDRLEFLSREAHCDNFLSHILMKFI